MTVNKSNSTTLKKCFIKHADEIINPSRDFSLLDKLGWQAASMHYKFNQKVLAQHNIQDDKDISLEHIKESTLGRGVYTSTLLANLKSEADKLYKKTGNPEDRFYKTDSSELFDQLSKDRKRYDALRKPFTKKMNELLREETIKYSTIISKGIDTNKRWSPIKLIKDVMKENTLGFSFNVKVSSTNYLAFCNNINDEFDACLALETSPLKTHSKSDMGLLILTKNGAINNDSYVSVFAYTDIFKPMNKKIYSHYNTPLELERNIRFALAAYSIILNNITPCFK